LNISLLRVARVVDLVLPAQAEAVAAVRVVLEPVLGLL
jgi:hypothetical protein